jgi:hypothetical protein
MFLSYEGRLKDFSRELRTHMTDAEKVLWMKLRRKQLKGYQFYRQKIVGDYIVDFYCLRARLVVEVDDTFGVRGLKSCGFRTEKCWWKGRVSWRRFTEVCRRGKSPHAPLYERGSLLSPPLKKGD